MNFRSENYISGEVLFDAGTVVIPNVGEGTLRRLLRSTCPREGRSLTAKSTPRLAIGWARRIESPLRVVG